MSLLVICEMSGVFVKTLTADSKHPLRYTEILPQTIQI